MKLKRKLTAGLFAVLLFLSGCTTEDPATPTVDLGAEGSLNCLEISRFSGGFVEDGSGAQVQDVAAILVANNTGKFLDLATITYKVGSRTATFKVTGLAHGKKAWVLETNRMTLKEGDELVPEDCEEIFNPSPVLSTNDLAVSRRDNALTLTNTSGRKLSNVAVYYKNTLEDGTFMGGITYMIVFGDMEPGTSVTQIRDHLGDDSEVVRFSYQ